MKRIHLWLALALLITVNTVVLTGVARNRSGPPDATLILTERELLLDTASRREENSGLSLRLNWRNEFVREWFGAEKLAELGIEIEAGDENPPAYRRRELPVEAFIVLEYEGEAWERHKREQRRELEELRQKPQLEESEEKQAERERGRIEADLAAGSRLFAVDVGPDPHMLRSRHPDGSRYLIVPALVRIGYPWRGKQLILHGTIDSILVDRLHVPRDLAGPLFELPEEGRLYRGTIYSEPEKPPAPRYQVRVHCGQRYEPWVAGVEILGQR